MPEAPIVKAVLFADTVRQGANKCFNVMGIFNEILVDEILKDGASLKHSFEVYVHAVNFNGTYTYSADLLFLNGTEEVKMVTAFLPKDFTIRNPLAHFQCCIPFKDTIFPWLGTYMIRLSFNKVQVHEVRLEVKKK